VQHSCSRIFVGTQPRTGGEITKGEYPLANNRQMQTNKGNAFAVGLALVSLGLLMSAPRCARGCRTLAEHLISHGLDELLAGLF